VKTQTDEESVFSVSISLQLTLSSRS